MALLKGELTIVVQQNRERLDRMAAELSEALFGPEGMPWGTKFSDLEDDAFELGQAIARRLVGRTVEAQASEPVPGELCHCPRCGTPVEKPLDEDGRETDAEEGRVLVTRSGEVTWCEPKRYCPTCRRDFFPSVEESGDRSVVS